MAPQTHDWRTVASPKPPPNKKYENIYHKSCGTGIPNHMNLLKNQVMLRIPIIPQFLSVIALRFWIRGFIAESQYELCDLTITIVVAVN